MSEKTLTTRITLSYDTNANWSNLTDFIPKKGEVIVVETGDRKSDYFVIGDGVTLLNDLKHYSNDQQFYNKGEIDDKFNNIQPPEVDLSNYYTQKETDDAIQNAINESIYTVLNTPV